jgi:hypothetical protein
VSKLKKLRESITLAEAAKHLSILFGEEATEADVLGLALDKKLKLSVDFPNGVEARHGRVVPWTETEWGIFLRALLVPDFVTRRMPGIRMAVPLEMQLEQIADRPPQLQALLSKWNWGELSNGEKSGFYLGLISLEVGENQYLNLSNEVTTIKGVWDLPMIGNERLKIEHEYHMRTGGPAVAAVDFRGTFVKRSNSDIWQLQTSKENNMSIPGSAAQGEKLKQDISNKKLDGAKVGRLLAKYAEDRENFCRRINSGDRSVGYEPGLDLPDDCAIVVRTEALWELEKLAAQGGQAAPRTETLEGSERTSVLKIIGGLAMGGYGINIHAERIGGIGELVKDLQRVGAPVTEKTLRQYLKEAAGIIEPRTPKS